MERADREYEDPFSLSPKKSLKNYWLHFNTWSIDGLPGFRQMPEITARANKDIIRKVMADTGLNYDDTLVARRGSPEWWFVLFVGVVLGFLLSTALNGNVVSVAKQLMRV